MTDQFVDFAKSQMGAIERLLKGLPGISGYIDKELRRDADKRVREGLVQLLEHSKSELMDIQNRLLKRRRPALHGRRGPGSREAADADRPGQDRRLWLCRPVSMPCASRKRSWMRCNRFDVAMINEVGQLNEAITALSNAVADNGNIGRHRQPCHQGGGRPEPAL